MRHGSRYVIVPESHGPVKVVLVDLAFVEQVTKLCDIAGHEAFGGVFAF